MSEEIGTFDINPLPPYLNVPISTIIFIGLKLDPHPPLTDNVRKYPVFFLVFPKGRVKKNSVFFDIVQKGGHQLSSVIEYPGMLLFT